MLGKRAMSFSGAEEVSGEGDLSDDCSHGGERKRRLNVEQVKTLEKNFEMGNKLEPERKMQLARALGLQPRQIAIWFQNRRARWKTKQLEKDFDLLKRQFDAVKAENDALHSLNKKLLTEVSLSLSLSFYPNYGCYHLHQLRQFSSSEGKWNWISIPLSLSLLLLSNYEWCRTHPLPQLSYSQGKWNLVSISSFLALQVLRVLDL